MCCTPKSFTSWSTSRPIGPHPSTATRISCRRWARSTAWIATPSGSSITPSAKSIVSGIGKHARLGQAIYSRSAPSCRPCPAKMTLSQRLGFPARHKSHSPQETAGSTATRRPPSVIPANSCPRMSGAARRASPIPPCPYQCKSDPQIPTAATRTRVSPSAGKGTVSSCIRRSPTACRRTAFITRLAYRWR